VLKLNRGLKCLCYQTRALDDRKLFVTLRRMKSLTEYLWFEVPGRRGFVNITATIEKLADKSGVREGLCLVNAMHITASVFINDEEDGLKHDYEVWLEKLAPPRTGSSISGYGSRFSTVSSTAIGASARW